MRVAVASVVAALTLGLAGCGSEDVGVGGESAAELLKPGALVYWESDSDPDSDQWNQTEELLRRFPDGESWITELRRSFERDTEVSWDEVEEALGPQLVVAVYARSTADEPMIVGLTKPDDPDKTVDVVKKLNASDQEEEDAVTRVVDGWVVVADEEAAIDAALKGEGAALATDDGFEAAMAELPDDALSRAYFDPAAAVDALGGTDEATDRQLRMLGLDRLDFGGAWAKAEDEGAELAFTLRGEGAERLLGTGDPYTSELIERVPADAFAFYSFRGDAVKQQFEQFRDNPLYELGIRQFERELGVRVDDLVTLFDGEIVFYARPGAPIPELTVLFETQDRERALQSADRLLRNLAQEAGARVTEDGDVTTAVFDQFSLNLGAAGEVVVLSTAKDAFGDDPAAGGGLSDADRYTDALAAAGAPDEYTGVAWVDLDEAVKLALGYAGSSGETVPPDVERNLEPLESLVAYGEQDGAVVSSLVFLAIE